MPPSQKTFCTPFVLAVLLSLSHAPMGIEVWWMNKKKISTGDETNILKTEQFNGFAKYLGKMCIKQWSCEHMALRKKRMQHAGVQWNIQAGTSSQSAFLYNTYHWLLLDKGYSLQYRTKKAFEWWLFTDFNLISVISVLLLICYLTGCTKHL